MRVSSTKNIITYLTLESLGDYLFTPRPTFHWSEYAY